MSKAHIQVYLVGHRGVTLGTTAGPLSFPLWSCYLSCFQLPRAKRFCSALLFYYDMFAIQPAELKESMSQFKIH